ncbi:MAG: 30S ribosomal protein S10 [Candidatus Magasanikbacteria bacterium]
MAEENQQEGKMRLKIRAYDSKLIDKSVSQIIEAIERRGGQIVGPVPLPTEVDRWTVNKSSFAHKTSREQFERKVHKRLIDIVNPEKDIIEALDNLTLPSGIDVEIKAI